MHYLLLFIYSFFLPASFAKTENQIEWNEQIPLTWDDFQGAPDPHASFETLSHFTMRYEVIEIQPDYITVSVELYFNKNLSWKREDAGTEELLVHERYHFHICEYYARKIRREFSNIKPGSAKEQNQRLKTIFKNNIVQKNHLNELYDEETSHSTLKIKQLEWEKKIDEMLASSPDFKSKLVRVRRK
jgi:hypothetical protein